MSRMKSSGFSLQPEAIRLTDFAAGILDSHGELLNEKGIDVVMEADGSDPLIIQADKRLFAKVLSNLISNACHYSPAGEEIRIQIAKADDAVGFSIENTGVHIPEEEIPGLFEPFTRGSRHVTGRQAEAVWGFLLCGWCWSCIIFLTGWKIQTTASDLVLYLPCREICVICRCFNLSLLDKTIPISYYTIN